MKILLIHSIRRISLVFIIGIAFNSLGVSQDISATVLTWEADEATDLETSRVINMKCQFKTNKNKTVEWIQKKGTLNAFYTVTTVDGSWENVTATGSINYTLERNGRFCKMTIEKSGLGTFVTMDFSKEGEYTSRQRFRIKSVQ